jgi:hypothetical protein
VPEWPAGSPRGQCEKHDKATREKQPRKLVSSVPMSQGVFTKDNIDT